MIKKKYSNIILFLLMFIGSACQAQAYGPENFLYMVQHDTLTTVPRTIISALSLFLTYRGCKILFPAAQVCKEYKLTTDQTGLVCAGFALGLAGLGCNLRSKEGLINLLVTNLGLNCLSCVDRFYNLRNLSIYKDEEKQSVLKQAAINAALVGVVYTSRNLLFSGPIG